MIISLSYASAPTWRWDMKDKNIEERVIKNQIMENIEKMDPSDLAFLKQLYTIVVKHLERTGRR